MSCNIVCCKSSPHFMSIRGGGKNSGMVKVGFMSLQPVLLALRPLHYIEEREHKYSEGIATA